MENFFIDKLNIVQNHKLPTIVTEGEGSEWDKVELVHYPEVCKYKLYKYDLQKKTLSESVTHLQLEGSYSSSIIIRCDGTHVECFGNPSRLGRMGNLYGFQTIDECVAVYNLILEQIGLPVFTKCTDYFFSDSYPGQEPKKIYNGAQITHIDFTRNLAVGMGNERAFNKALSTQSISRSISPSLYPDENTVEWYGKNMQKNGSHYRYIKC